MLLLTSAVSGALNLEFTVDGFGAAFLGAIVVAIVGLLLSMLVRTGRLASKPL
jgi:putative membrane protein